MDKSKSCLQCGQPVRNKFCNTTCSGKYNYYRRKNARGIQEKAWTALRGKVAWNKGRKATPEEIEKNRLGHLGQKANKGSFKEGKHVSKRTEFKKGDVSPRKGKHFDKIRGKNHWNWKGGISFGKRRTKELEYRLWRQAVFERDEFACIKCGNNKSGNLEADHIKPWALFPELRYAIDNGQILCINCHKEKSRADKMIYFNEKYQEIN